MPIEHERARRGVRWNTVRSVSRICLAVIGLVFLFYIFRTLPGMNRMIPLIPISFSTLIGVFVTIIIVALLIYLATGFAALTRMLIDGPTVVVEHIASVVHWLVVLVAILVAHNGLESIVSPLLFGRVWLYDLLFFIIAVPPLVIIAIRMYFSLDPLADLVADHVTDEPGRR